MIFFCLLCEGNVDVVKENAGGSSKKILTLGPGKILGEISFFDSGPCSASLIAKDPVKLLLFDKENFQKLSTELPGIALTIVVTLMSSLSKRLRQTTGKLIDLL